MRRAKHASAVATLLALVWMPGPPAWAQTLDLADPPDAGSETTPDIRPNDLKASGWRVECANDGSVLSCITVLRLLRDGDNQPLVTLAVTRLNAASPDQLTPREKTAAPTAVAWLSAQLPLGVRLDAPIQLQIDAGPTVDLIAQICLPRGCSAGTALTQTFIDAARQGQQAHLRLRLNDAQTLDLGLPLGGFGLAYEKL